VFSNAALHWVPHHASLFARLHAALVAGGQLAVQMPMNRDAPDHVICDQLLREAPYVDVLGGVGVRQYTLPVEQYATLLWKLGFRTQTVRLHVYGHKMASRDGVLEWVKGALLTDVKKRLPDELWQRFLAAYTSRLMDKLVDDKPYLYTMKRVFLWAEK
jgi:trans-aconitate 2-methyltransferase